MKGDVKQRRLRVQSAQQRFIKALFQSFGGRPKVAELLKDHIGIELGRQGALNWEQRGVPLEQIFKVAKILNVSPYALNHKAMCEMTGKKVPWEEAIRARFERVEIG